MDTRPDMAAWLKAYIQTHEELERMRARELAAMTDEQALRQIRNLVCAGEPWRERRDWSGLIEQQRLFILARQRNKP